MKEVVRTVEEYISGQNTFFVLENLDTLRKNGRLSGVKAFVATALKIKPVMGSTDEGTICQLDQARGMNKALVKMMEHIVSKTSDGEKKVWLFVTVTVRNELRCLRRPLQKKTESCADYRTDTAGVSTMYANDGGIIVAV